VYTVPQSIDAASVNSDSPFATEESRTQPNATVERWRLRTEDGNVYGPVAKTEVDSWLTEGRITAGCQLQRDGSMEWTPASTIYPVLTKSAARTTHANPFSDTPGLRANPYVAPIATATTIRARYRQPHRGGLILGFGIVGIVCCNVIAPAAWIMGQSDLNQIRSGRMDPAGRGLTQAGMVLGIIGTVLLALQGVLLVVTAIAS